jgi:predicted PurR-regulated permease PerM
MATEYWVRFTVGMVLTVVGVYLSYQLRFVLVTVALAAMLAYALLPLVEFGARLGIAGRAMPRIVATTLVFIAVIVVAIGTSRLAAAPVSDQVRRFAENVEQHRDQLNVALSRARISLETGIPQRLRQALDTALNQSGTLLLSALGHVARTTAEWLSHVVEILLIPILAFYFLVDLPVLKQELLGFLPATTHPQVLRALSCLDRILAAYVRGQLILMCISAVVVWAGLTLMGVHLALLLGIVGGLTRAIPIVGPILGAIPIVSIVFLQSPGAAAAALLFFVVLQIVESKVILPQVIGGHLRLHAVTILVALLIGNALFGLPGIFMAPPAAAFVHDILDLMYQRRAGSGHAIDGSC